jgi:hypothetical protein
MLQLQTLRHHQQVLPLRITHALSRNIVP